MHFCVLRPKLSSPGAWSHLRRSRRNRSRRGLALTRCCGSAGRRPPRRGNGGTRYPRDAVARWGGASRLQFRGIPTVAFDVPSRQGPSAAKPVAGGTMLARGDATATESVSAECNGCRTIPSGERSAGHEYRGTNRRLICPVGRSDKHERPYRSGDRRRSASTRNRDVKPTTVQRCCFQTLHSRCASGADGGTQREEDSS